MMQKREGIQRGQELNPKGRAGLEEESRDIYFFHSKVGKSAFVGGEANKLAALVGTVKQFEFTCFCFLSDVSGRVISQEGEKRSCKVVSCWARFSADFEISDNKGRPVI